LHRYVLCLLDDGAPWLLFVDEDAADPANRLVEVAQAAPGSPAAESAGSLAWGCQMGRDRDREEIRRRSGGDREEIGRRSSLALAEAGLSRGELR